MSTSIQLARAGVLSAVLLGACDGGSATDPRGAVRRVILVTCDTLRADHLGLYGYERDTSPELDAFAREGVVFDSAWSTTSSTNPSTASLMTGRMPDELGVSGGNRRYLQEEVITLAEVLRDAGIPTAAIVSNWVLRRMREGDVGLQQGFVHFDDRMSVRELHRESYERRGPDTTAAAIDWLEHGREGAEGFFLWVHYQDPHGPYTPPDELARQFEGSPAGAARLRFGKTHKGRGQIPSYQLLGDEHRPGPYRDRYDAEIRFFDTAVGELFDWLRAHDLWEDTLLVFSSDHGESLGENDYWFCHGETLQDELVHVPFIVRYPDGVTRPAVERIDGYARSDALVGHLDVWATVLDAFGLPARPSRGTSLLARELPGDRVLAQSLHHANTTVRIDGVTDGRWRLVLDRTGNHLYRVRAAAGEEVDAAADHPDVVAELLRLHALYVANAPGPPVEESEEIALDEEAARALDALGYLEGDAQGEE